MYSRLCGEPSVDDIFAEGSARKTIRQFVALQHPSLSKTIFFRMMESYLLSFPLVLHSQKVVEMLMNHEHKVGFPSGTPLPKEWERCD